MSLGEEKQQKEELMLASSSDRRQIRKHELVGNSNPERIPYPPAMRHHRSSDAINSGIRMPKALRIPSCQANPVFIPYTDLNL